MLFEKAMNMFNVFKMNRKGNRLKKWAITPVTTSIGVAAVTTMIGMSPFQTVSGAEQPYSERGWVHPQNQVLSYHLSIDPTQGRDSTNCFVKIYKAYDRTDQDQEYCFTPRMAFVLNPDGGIIQNVSTNRSMVRASFIVETYNPFINDLIAARSLMDKKFQMSTNHIRFSPLPVNSAAVKVVGSDGTVLSVMDQTNVSLTGATEFPFHLDFSQDNYDQFLRDLENNTVHFDFTLNADRVKYDVIDLKVEVMADIANAFKSLLGSDKVIALDQESWKHFKNFVALNVVMTGRVSNPAYLSVIGDREAIVMQFINLCFDVITDDPNGEYAKAETFNMPPIPMTVRTSQDEQNKGDTTTDQHSRVVTRTKEAEVSGICKYFSGSGGISETKTDTDAHDNVKSLLITKSDGKTEQDLDKHSYVRLALRDNIAELTVSAQQHIQLPCAIDQDHVSVTTYPAITTDNVEAWSSDFQSNQITKYVADFETERSELLKKYTEFDVNNAQIETRKHQAKTKIDTITKRLETSSQGTLSQQMNERLTTLLSDGVWRTLNVKAEAPKDGDNIAAWFKKAVAGLTDVKVSLSDEKDVTDYERAIRNLKRFKPSKDPLETIQGISRHLVLQEDLLDRLEVRLEDQTKTLENLEYLNKKLAAFIVGTQ